MSNGKKALCGFLVLSKQHVVPVFVPNVLLTFGGKRELDEQAAHREYKAGSCPEFGFIQFYVSLKGNRNLTC